MSNCYLSPEELADRWAVTKQLLYTMRCRGEGPDFQKISARVVRYPLESVEIYEANALVRHVAEL